MKLTDPGLPDQLARKILPPGTDPKTISKLSQQMAWAWNKGKIQTTPKQETRTRRNNLDGRYYDHTTRVNYIALGDAAEWARENGFTVRDEILELLPPDATQSPPPGSGGKWPWGDHETELLRHLAAAAERFWTNHDPKQPDTAPTNDQVRDWLVSRGVSKYLAASIASILRADNLPAGRRR